MPLGRYDLPPWLPGSGDCPISAEPPQPVTDGRYPTEEVVVKATRRRKKTKHPVDALLKMEDAATAGMTLRSSAREEMSAAESAARRPTSSLGTAA